MTGVVKIHERDNVAVALDDLRGGDIAALSGGVLPVREDIPRGHKLAAAHIEPGDSVMKYGFPIGRATRLILPGQHVHTHNLETNLRGEPGVYEYRPAPEHAAAETAALPAGAASFQGYLRADGGAGIRNELWIIPLVGCVNAVGEQIKHRFLERTAALCCDGVNVLRHEYGCSQLGDDHENTRKILRNFVRHPNAGGVLVLGLGCENNTLEAFKDGLGDYDARRVRFLKAQEVPDETEAGVRLLEELYESMKTDARTDIPVSRLRLGLKCGGSDGFSGITANPLLGRLADRITAAGGTVVLTEVPETFGAETLLTARARDKEVFDRIARMIDGFKRYFTEHDQPVDENPSPGNREGGITTLEEKSLGCVQKAGNSPVTDVLDYGDTLRTQGLNLLCAPGNDLVSSTALAAAGCQMILFSTGRGTPYGTVAPTVKISANTALYQKKPGWIDFDAGGIAAGEPMDALAEALVRYVLAVAGGRQTNNERNGCRELAIWKNGVTL